MKKVIINVFLILFLTGCEDCEFMAQNINSVLIGADSLYGDGAENILPGNYVITNQTGWNTLLTQMNSVNPNTTQSFISTNIDFSNYQIIAVFDIIRPNSGRTINITEIIENENSISITVVAVGPGGATSVITQPFQIVKIPKSNKPIVFQ